MITFILIIVLASYGMERPALTSITQEFHTKETCEEALKQLNVTLRTARGQHTVLAASCFRK